MTAMAYPGAPLPPLAGRLPLGGRERAFTLLVPEAGALLRLVFEPASRQAPSLVEGALVGELMHLLDTLEGRPLEVADAEAIARDPHALGAVFALRNRLCAHLLECGRAFAQCPHCHAWEAELDLLYYTLALHPPAWELFERGVWLAPPRLSERRPPGARPRGGALTSRLRVALPSGRDAEIGDLDAVPGREDAAWARLRAWREEVSERYGRGELDEANEDEYFERVHWREDHPGFRAALRLALALVRLDGVAGEPSPEAVERLPLGDFLFLDRLYALAHDVEVRSFERLTLTCERCGDTFLPLLPGVPKALRVPPPER